MPRGQVVSFRTGSDPGPRKFVSGLNHLPAGGYRGKPAGCGQRRFNVMKDAVSREYRYQIMNRRPRSPLENDMYYHVMTELDAGLMNRAAGLLIGEHDFASFVTGWDRRESTVRCIYDAGVEREGEKVAFQVGPMRS